MKNLDSLKIASKFLKSQREKKELSLKEVSIELRLEKKIILDIESGNFDNFKSYLFLKGYIKNYANFLGVKVNLPEAKIKKNKKNISKKESNISPIGNKKKVTYITILIFLFIIFFTFNERDKSSDELIISPSINIKNTNIEKTKNSIPSISADVENNKIDEEIKNIQEIEIEENKIQLEIPFDNNEKLSDFRNNDNISKNISTKPISSTSTINDVFLEITYKGDSWTEIIDSKGDIIYFDLVKRGKTVKFNILAPFEILLGDVTVVDIKYNNKIISIPYFNPDTNVGKIKIKK